MEITPTHVVNDSDLEHLIAETSSTMKNKSPLFIEKEYLASVDCISLTSTYLAFLCSYHKTGVLITLGFALFLSVAIFGLTTTHAAPTLARDYTNVKLESVLDHRLGKIDHWCLNGGDEACTCSDPLEEENQKEKPGWSKAHKKNKFQVARSIASGNDLDVVFVGDAMIEFLAGRMMGENLDKDSPFVNAQVSFKQNFNNNNNKDGHFDGIALGISGDTSPNLLWRLRHGEMAGINPKVWWINIGIGDLARQECSEEVVVLGILRIVEEIRREKPSATIVINGLLPTTKVRGGMPTNEKARFKKWTGKNLWPSIQLINDVLGKFAEKHDRIHFFDPKPVFTQKGRKNNYIIMKALKADPIHPSKQGFNKWVKAMSENMNKYLNS